VAVNSVTRIVVGKTGTMSSSHATRVTRLVFKNCQKCSPTHFFVKLYA
jgi:hypothetical protein